MDIMIRRYLMVIIISFLVVIVGVNDDKIDISLFSGNVDVLASTESGIPEDGIIYNSKEMELWWELSANKYYINMPDKPAGTCLKVTCCAPSTDMDCCDFYQVGWECDDVNYNYRNL